MRQGTEINFFSYSVKAGMKEPSATRNQQQQPVDDTQQLSCFQHLHHHTPPPLSKTTLRLARCHPGKRCMCVALGINLMQLF